MAEWTVLDSGVRSAEENMRLDQQLLLELHADSPCLLHLYEWERPSVTYGYFIDPGRHLRMEELEAMGIACARRPTGGGIVFHLWDMAFSLLLPPRYVHARALDNYAMVHAAVLGAVRAFLGAGKSEEMPLSLLEGEAPVPSASFCMAAPTRYDLMWQGRKVAGAAQRRTRQGLLHQGTLALQLPPQAQLERLLLNGCLAEAMRRTTYPLLRAQQEAQQGGQQETRVSAAKERLRALLHDYLMRHIA